MRSFVALVTVAACLLSVAAQDFNPDDPLMRSGAQLSILEIRKVNSESSFGMRDYEVRVKLDEHAPLTELDIWRLITIHNTGNQDYYDAEVRPDNLGSKEFQFKANLTDRIGAFIQAIDTTNKILGSGYVLLNQTVFNSTRAAWVAAPHSDTKSSLRVWTDNLEVEVGRDVCRKEDAPCYMLSTFLPTTIARCVTSSGVLQCDDFVTKFRGITKPLTLEVSEGFMTAEYSMTSSPATMEMVVFDPDQPSKIFSPANDYRCYQPVIPYKEDPLGKSSCNQQLQDTGDLRQLKVLLVALDEDGYVLESRLGTYTAAEAIETTSTTEASTTPPPEDKTGMIVGSVIGALVLLAIIVGIVVYVMKKKKKSGASATRRSGPGVEYQAAATGDKPARGEA